MLQAYPAKQTYFDREAAGYDRRITSNPLRRFMWDREFRALEKLTRERVFSSSLILDAPTGTGRFVPLLQALGHQVVGIDISSHMIREFRRRAGQRNGNFMVGDCEALPFDDGVFDYVFTLRFMGHLPPATRVRVLREFRRVARRGIVAGYPILNPLTKLKFKLGNTCFWLKERRARPWWPATSQSLSAELALAGLKVAHEEKLLGPFSQISFLCLAREEEPGSGGIPSGREAEFAGSGRIRH
ncbi:MAG: class I SAM-dependent methyltransferase [Terriglobia bacterium]